MTVNMLKYVLDNLFTNGTPYYFPLICVCASVCNIVDKLHTQGFPQGSNIKGQS